MKVGYVKLTGSDISKVTKRVEEDGVTYTIDGESGDCIDIDVKPGVEEVRFEASFGRIYRLSDCKKDFPDVRKITIDYSVYDIDIPNSLFPNVKEVECNSWYGKYTKSGSVLLRNDNGQILTNVFVKQEGETVDLKYATKIDDDAFAGCMTTKIINSGSVTSCAEYAFRNSAIGDLKPEPAGAAIVGSILVNIDETSENIILPDKRVSLTAIRDGINFGNIKSITINRVQTAIKLQNQLPDGIKIILNDKSYITDKQFSEWNRFPVLELTEENPYYSTKDGCLLSKDGLVLVKYPSAVSGAIHIPEGVETIAPYAFFLSEVEEVYFPDSLKTMMSASFYYCKKLKKIDFGHGIEELGIGHDCRLFFGCDMLQEVDIPPQVRIIGESAFLGTEVNKVIFHEGLTQISDFAFRQTKVKEVTLPASLKYIGRENFSKVEKITLMSDNIPYGIAEAVTLNTTSDDKMLFIEIKKPNSTVFLPRYIVTADAASLDTRLAIPSFREKCEESLYDYGIQPEIKWKTAIKTMEECPNDAVKTYLRRVSKNIIAMYMELNDETGLIDFIKLGVMTPKALDDAYKKAKENGLTTVMAYICEAQKDMASGKSSFSL